MNAPVNYSPMLPFSICILWWVSSKAPARNMWTNDLVVLTFFLFVYCWLHWVFAAARRPSLVAVHGATLHCGARTSHCGVFSGCGTQALGEWASVVVVRRLYRVSSVLVAHWLSCPKEYGIFLDQGWNTCLARWILIHCATREVPLWKLLTSPKFTCLSVEGILIIPVFGIFGFLLQWLPLIIYGTFIVPICCQICHNFKMHHYFTYS